MLENLKDNDTLFITDNYGDTICFNFNKNDNHVYIDDPGVDMRISESNAKKIVDWLSSKFDS